MWLNIKLNFEEQVSHCEKLILTYQVERLWRVLKTKQHVRKDSKSTRSHQRKLKSIKNLQKR